MPKQSKPTLRRKKRTKNGTSVHSALVIPCLVIGAFVLLAAVGLLLEGARSNSTSTITTTTEQDSSSSLRRATNADPSDSSQSSERAVGKLHQAAAASSSSTKKNAALSHLFPIAPVLPIFTPIPNAEQLVYDLLHNNRPTMAGIQALLQEFLTKLHAFNYQFGQTHEHGAGHGMEIVNNYFTLAQQYLGALDQAYRGRSIFPVRTDGSIYLSLAAYREHLLAYTMECAFTQAKDPDKLYIGAVVQNCFGKVNPDGTIDTSGKPCKTGVEVVGKTANGRPKTKISDRGPDVNGIADFCAKPEFAKYCANGQVRVLYVHETESLGPAVARYYASKLWGGETYFIQCDSHLQFAAEWDEKYRLEIQATSSYPKSVLSSYPPGFSEANGATVRESNGARLCTCDTRLDDPNPIVRINTGVGYSGKEERPTQIPFIAAGFFFARAEFLTDWPFDPYLPWLFMGEEIALSMRAWTHGWNIYAPRKNLIAHQYRPGRLGLPKFWETASRVYKGPGMNNILQGKVIPRIKNMVGYPDSTAEKIHKEGLDIVLTEIEQYGLGKNRTWEDYLTFASMSIDEENDVIVCSRNQWCNKGLKD